MPDKERDRRLVALCRSAAAEKAGQARATVRGDAGRTRPNQVTPPWPATPSPLLPSRLIPPQSWSASPGGPDPALQGSVAAPLQSSPWRGAGVRLERPSTITQPWAAQGGRWALWTPSCWSGRSPGGRCCPSPLESRSRLGLGSPALARVSSSRPSASVLLIRTL